MAGAGRCSLAAVSVPGRCVLFPSRYFAGAVLACVRLSSCVSSVSPVVAAVGLAVAASQWLAALGSHRAQGSNKISAGNEISLSAAAERKTKPTNHETQMRMTRNTLRLASTRAQTNSDHHLPVTPATPPVAVWRTRWTAPLVGLASPEERQPLRPWRSGEPGGRLRSSGSLRRDEVSSLALGIASRSQPRSAQPAYAIHHRTLVAARGCCRSCPPAPRRCGHRAASRLIERHSPRPSHCPRARRKPHQFGSEQRCRTSWVIGRPSRARASTRKLALRGISTMRR